MFLIALFRIGMIMNQTTMNKHIVASKPRSTVTNWEDGECINVNMNSGGTSSVNSKVVSTTNSAVQF